MKGLGRIWPQKVRTRLALLYALLFLISGSALLGLTYGLVAANLPATPVSPASTSGTGAPVTRASHPAAAPRPRAAWPRGISPRRPVPGPARPGRACDGDVTSAAAR